jgi:hypothetical protein
VVEQDASACRDWVNDRRVSFLVWKLPAIVLCVSLVLPIGNVGTTAIWVASLGVLGGACVLNAVRCRRLHCFLTGPFFLIMALASLVHGFGIVSLGSGGFYWLGAVTGVGAFVLLYLPERIWGRYAPTRVRGRTA